MSMYNDADITVEIKLKNNAIIRTKMHVSGNKMWPMGENSDSLVSPTIEEIDSGDMLLQYIYKSYFPYSCHWSDSGDIYFDNKADKDKIVKIEDFDLVDEITIKEKFHWDEGENTTQEFLINSENCPFINDKPIFTEDELRNKKTTLPSNITFIGKDAFLGCEKLNIFVEEYTLTHSTLAKQGMAYYLINEKNSISNTCAQMTKKVHCWEELYDYPKYHNYEFDVLRIMTASDIYILFINYPEEEFVENNLTLCFNPDDYMPEIVGGELTWGNFNINTVTELATTLFYVGFDVIDFEMLNAYLNFCVDKITIDKTIEIFLNCHKSNSLNAFKKGSFDSIKDLDLLSMNASEKKIAVLNIVEKVFKTVLPNFKEVIVPFVEVCKSINDIKEIQIVEVSKGFIGENELDEEELWDSDFKLDFSLLQI